MSRESNKKHQSMIALLIIIAVSATFHSCSDPYDKLLGRWVQSHEYTIADGFNNSVVETEKEFIYWEFEPDTLEMDGIRVAYRIVEDELVMDPIQDTVIFIILDLSSDRLFVTRRTKDYRNRKFYSFKR